MEGVGARLGRSSSRYSGPAVVFSGPVRKWKKKWVHVPSPNNNNHHHHSSANAGSNASSQLLLYKWTPEPSTAASNGTPSTPAAGAKDPEEESAATAGGKKRRFRYVPISIVEEQKQETTAKADDESKDGNDDAMALKDSSTSKADTNDAMMQDVNDSDKDGAGSEDASQTHLDLNLGLKAHEGKHESDQTQGGEESIEPSETEHRGKRKAPDLEMRM